MSPSTPRYGLFTGKVTQFLAIDPGFSRPPALVAGGERKFSLARGHERGQNRQKYDELRGLFDSVDTTACRERPFDQAQARRSRTVCLRDHMDG